jgi:hypothetical protein
MERMGCYNRGLARQEGCTEHAASKRSLHHLTRWLRRAAGFTAGVADQVAKDRALEITLALSLPGSTAGWAE